MVDRGPQLKESEVEQKKCLNGVELSDDKGGRDRVSFPKEPSVLKIVRRAHSLRREREREKKKKKKRREKKTTAIAKRYGECSKVLELVFL